MIARTGACSRRPLRSGRSAPPEGEATKAATAAEAPKQRASSAGRRSASSCARTKGESRSGARTESSRRQAGRRARGGPSRGAARRAIHGEHQRGEGEAEGGTRTDEESRAAGVATERRGGGAGEEGAAGERVPELRGGERQRGEGDGHGVGGRGGERDGGSEERWGERGWRAHEGGGARSGPGHGSTRTSTTVMLSGPPCSLAICTRTRGRLRPLLPAREPRRAAPPRAPPARAALEARLPRRHAPGPLGDGPAARSTRPGARELELVFTAHPTEARRRRSWTSTVPRRPTSRGATRRLTSELDGVDAAIREEVTTLWQTDEIRHGRVGDEVRPLFSWRRCAPVRSRRAGGGRRAARASGVVVPALRLVGGRDMDGTQVPDVAGERRSARRRALALHARVARVGDALSQSTRAVPASRRRTPSPPTRPLRARAGSPRHRALRQARSGGRSPPATPLRARRRGARRRAGRPRAVADLAVIERSLAAPRARGCAAWGWEVSVPSRARRGCPRVGAERRWGPTRRPTRRCPPPALDGCGCPPR